MISKKLDRWLSLFSFLLGVSFFPIAAVVVLFVASDTTPPAVVQVQDSDSESPPKGSDRRDS